MEHGANARGAGQGLRQIEPNAELVGISQSGVILPSDVGAAWSDREATAGARDRVRERKVRGSLARARRVRVSKGALRTARVRGDRRDPAARPQNAVK